MNKITSIVLSASPRRIYGLVGAGMVILLLLVTMMNLRAQSTPVQSYLPPAQASSQAKLTPEAIQQLMAPIALYPDALVGLILPASTVPSDVVLGARYVANGGDPAATTNQPWDDSVKGLTRYPDVLKWMDSNLDWTTSLGQAFIAQPADVMNAIQFLRTQAKTAGNLTDTPQQKIVMEKEVIRIVPAQPEVIYVPRYNPNLVYTQPYAEGLNPLLTFGAGFAVGAWLGYDFDWGNRGFYRGPWRGWGNGNGYGYGNGGGNNGGGVNVVNINNNNTTVWRPSSAALAQQARLQRNNQVNTRVARINSLAAAPNNNTSVTTTRAERQANRHGNNANILRPSSFATQADMRTINAGKNPRNIPVATENTLPKMQTAPVTSNTSTDRHGRANHNATTQAPVTAAPNVSGQAGAPHAVTATGNAARHGRHGTSGSGSSTVPTVAPNVSGQTANPAQVVAPTANATRHGRHNTTTGSGSSTAPTSAPPVTNQSRPTTTTSRHNNAQSNRNNAPSTAPGVSNQQQPRAQSSNRHAQQSVNTQAPSATAPDKSQHRNANSNANHAAASKAQAQKAPAHSSQPASDKKKAASKNDKKKADKTN